ncbi:hypothetical protein METBIDRAFT_183832 [Metschnikowia bicuspidata var. bicuspidata NRRL YB-4993]|uniref:GATA-type domain-containing protein n=1 Tax=Metschnikowia bicuspidata var. bicuspidata NRRL YB-4993 TaxID=869754 RepID=A0A1A0HBM3_9ASCO|nr:hypothetical protein METBIDRAFT_183832 [Metschnikowia bicuspidata var. bicuspidata NRRL YB-4993]OBA21411.1 hypothetical protein METBIDRAFT_183832 [Metschnikowia bicuspidata var. bicuspidata NRRL YB-4993]
MYDSSWEKVSRSSHPNLWSPPIVTPIGRGAMSETETDLSSQFPMLSPADTQRRERLPSVDEILFKIRHQETSCPPYSQEYHLVPPTFPQAYQNQQQPSIAHWQQPSLRTSQYQFDQRAGSSHAWKDEGAMNPGGPFAAATLQVASGPFVPSLPLHTAQGTPAKKRGRKKKSDTICSHCQLTQTPEWRRGPDGSRTLCNACGLFYLKLTKKFGIQDANMVFAYKKRHNEVQDRVVPSVQQKNRYLSESLAD